MAEVVFRQKFRHNLKLVDRRLDAYIKNPDDQKNVKSVRTALRRLDAVFSLLPKKLRRQNCKKIEKYKEFFKANSNVRDYDMISSKMIMLSAFDVSSDLEKKRRAELQKALRLARALKKMTPVQVDSISDDKLRERMRGLTDKLVGTIKELLPVVLSDSSKIKEIHKLRKDCKKLRYILEAMPEDSKLKYEKMAARAIRNKKLKELQDHLGAVHDSDVTIGYLRRIRRIKLAEKEAANRKQQYLAFIRYMKK